MFFSLHSHALLSKDVSFGYEIYDGAQVASIIIIPLLLASSSGELASSVLACSVVVDLSDNFAGGQALAKIHHYGRIKWLLAVIKSFVVAENFQHCLSC